MHVDQGQCLGEHVGKSGECSFATFLSVRACVGAPCKYVLGGFGRGCELKGADRQSRSFELMDEVGDRIPIGKVRRWCAHLDDEFR